MLWASVALPAAENFINLRSLQGLPSNKVNALAQTPDGYVWMGTPEGVVRFDGVAFTAFDSSNVPEIHDSGVNCLYAAADGTLWIGHPSGAITSVKGGVFQRHPPRRDWKAGIVRGIVQDDRGDVWIWDDAGELARLKDGKVLRPERGPAAGVRQIAATPDGTIWISSRGRLSRLRHGELSVVPLGKTMAPYIQGVCATRDNCLWVVAEGILWKWSNDAWSGPYGTLSLGTSPVHPMVELKDGRLLAGTANHGALVINPMPFSEKYFSRATGFASDWVMSALEDREGGLWLGTGGAGVFRTRQQAITMLVPPDAWQGRPVIGVTTAHDGGLWVATDGSGLYRWDGHTWRNFGPEAGIRHPYIWAVTEDVSGRLWLGTSGGGLYRATGNGFELAPGFDTVAPPMRSIQARAAGGIWLGTLRGLVRYQSEPQWVLTGDRSPLRDVRAISEEGDGRLWAGSYGDGLSLVQDGRVARRYTSADGLGSDFVQSLYRDAAGALWIGTRGGLSRLRDDKIVTISTRHGLADNFIGHLIEDDTGNLWIASHGGIMRLRKAELDACADGKIARVDCLVYGLNDGLSTLVCSVGLQPSACRLPDGRLAFATDLGIALLDPKMLPTNRHPAPVVIESVRAGETLLASGHLDGREVRVAPGMSRIEIKYAGLSFEAPEKVRFRYRLEGLDRNWIEAANERMAVYNHVPPGEYVFRLMASNNDSVWNETRSGVRIVVLPHFWQTLWFKLCILFLLLGVTGMGVAARARWKWQRALEESERKRAVELERARIARDMHDDLGAQLTRITMLSETAKNEPARAREGLATIYETARQVTRAMDEIVWAINPRHDALDSMVFYFEKFACDFLATAGIHCRLEMPADFPAWNPSSEIRHSLFLGLKEALNNAVRHSGADTVTVGLEIGPARGCLYIRDNGLGLVKSRGAGVRTSGGNGLANLRERMERLGGRCDVVEPPAGGTEVRLEFSARPDISHRNL